MSSTKKTIQLNKHIIIILLETKTVKIIKFKTLIMLRGNESPGAHRGRRDGVHLLCRGYHWTRRSVRAA